MPSMSPRYARAARSATCRAATFAGPATAGGAATSSAVSPAVSVRATRTGPSCADPVRHARAATDRPGSGEQADRLAPPPRGDVLDRVGEEDPVGLLGDV